MKKGSTFTLTAGALVRRLVALVPPPKRHLTSFHGSDAPNARLRPLVTQTVASPLPANGFASDSGAQEAAEAGSPRLGWSFTKGPSAPTCCVAPAVAAARFARCIPPASRPRGD